MGMLIRRNPSIYGFTNRINYPAGPDPGDFAQGGQRKQFLLHLEAGGWFSC